MLGDGTVYNTGDNEAGILVVTALSTDGDHFRRAIADQKLEAEVVERTAEMPHVQLQGPKSRELLASLTDADIESLRYFRFLEDVTIGGVAGCLVSRTGYSGELGFEIYTSPANAERLWSALLDPGQSLGIRPYGLAAVESLRIESGLIFIGFDYFPAYTSPFHMNLDRMIKLDKAASWARTPSWPSTRPESRIAWPRSSSPARRLPTTTRPSTAMGGRSGACSRPAPDVRRPSTG